jgi:hypothetical protein
MMVTTEQIDDLENIVKNALVEFGSQSLCSGDLVRDRFLDVWNVVQSIHTPMQDADQPLMAVRLDDDRN